MTSWPTVPLISALELLIDHRGKTPKKLGGDWADSGVRVISAINIKDGRVDYENVRFIAHDLYNRWMPIPLQAGDVLLTSEAPLGEVAFWSSDTEAGLGQRLFALRAKKGLVHDRYLYYWLTSSDAQSQLHGRATGTTVGGIRQSELVQVRISLPPIDEQRAIAELLGALDDKSEANGRLVEHARESAKTVLLAASIGGKRTRVGDIAQVRKGLSYKGSGLSDVGMPMVNMGSAAPNGWLKRDGFKHYTGPFKPRHVAVGGQLLVVNTEQTWRQEIIGWPMILPSDVPEALFTHHVFLVDLQSRWQSARLALWAHLFTPEARAFIDGRVYGTTVATLPATAISDISFPLPKENSDAYGTADLLLKRAWAAEVESSSLRSLRDSLTAGIFSGRIRVPEARDQVRATL